MKNKQAVCDNAKKIAWIHTSSFGIQKVEKGLFQLSTVVGGEAISEKVSSEYKGGFC